MSEQFLAELERKLQDLAYGDTWGIGDKLDALAREVAVELERIRLAKREAA